MAHKFVNDIWFRSILRIRMVSNVLGWMEDFKCKTIQELSLGKKPTNWFQLPSSSTLQIFRDTSKLWDGSRTKSFNILFHIWNCLIGFFTSICFQHGLQFWIAVVPGFCLIFVVINSRNFLTNSVCKRDICYLFSSFPIFWVSKTWMICFLDSFSFSKCFFTNEIKIFDSCWEPWYFRCTDFLNIVCYQTKFFDGFLDISICGVAFDVNEKVGFTPVIQNDFGW